MTTRSQRASSARISHADRDRLDLLHAKTGLSREDVIHKLLNSPCAEEQLRGGDYLALFPMDIIDRLNGLARLYGFSVDMLVYEMAAAYAAKVAKDAKQTAALMAASRRALAERTTDEI